MNDKQFDVLDILNIMSFYIGIKNLDENLSQGQAQDLLNIAVEDIHKHLRDQDVKINKIMEVLGIEKN